MSAHSAATLALTDLERRLRELLAALDHPRSDAQSLERAWKACAGAFDAVGPFAPEARALGGDELADVRRLARSVAGLHALACDAASRERVVTNATLDKVSRTRAKLGALASAERAGRSLDLEG